VQMWFRVVSQYVLGRRSCIDQYGRGKSHANYTLTNKNTLLVVIREGW
jgi:hypothetical protein